MSRRILVLTTTYPLSDQDYQPGFVKGLCDELRKEHEVYVLAPSVAGDLGDVSDKNITRFRYCFSKWETLAGGQGILENLKLSKWRYCLIPFMVLSMFWHASRLIKINRIDLVHAHWILPQGLVAVALKVLNPQVKVIVTSHGGDLFALNGKVLTSIKAFILKKSDRITVVSKAMKDYTVKFLGVPCSKIVVRSMGIDTRVKFVPGEIKKEASIVFVGRLVEKKGLDTLLEAASLLKQRMVDFHLTVVGGGERLENYIEKSSEINVREKISFKGALTSDEVAFRMGESAIAVFPFCIDSNGDQEGLGLTTVEAMACGCAVIASDLPAIADVIEPGIDGIIVESKNPKVLADSIESLLMSPDYAKKLGRNGRSKAQTMFDWSSVGSAYSELLDSVCRGK